jgi:hypothetical protein
LCGRHGWCSSIFRVISSNQSHSMDQNSRKMDLQQDGRYAIVGGRLGHQ